MTTHSNNTEKSIYDLIDDTSLLLKETAKRVDNFTSLATSKHTFFQSNGAIGNVMAQAKAVIGDKIDEINDLGSTLRFNTSHDLSFGDAEPEPERNVIFQM